MNTPPGPWRRYDDPATTPYSGLSPAKDADTPAWRALAKQAAAQSLVLLSNTPAGAVPGAKPRLPLERGTPGLVLIGPNANASTTMQVPAPAPRPAHTRRVLLAALPRPPPVRGEPRASPSMASRLPPGVGDATSSLTTS